MTYLKRMAFAGVLSLCLFSSCQKDNEAPGSSRFVSSKDTFFSGTDQVPANTSTANGRVEGSYDRRNKLYTYKLTWSGLTSVVTAIHIHGLADKGYLALPPPLGIYTGGVVQTAFNNTTAVNGSYSGTLFVDGTAIKEADLLAGKFYIDIHTINFPGGEIRGQLLFP